MRIALICPRDFTAYLCCKWIIKILQKKGNKIYILTTMSDDNFYYNELIKLNIKFINLKMNRHINIIEDLRYFFSLIYILKSNNIDSIFSFCTKPNIYSPLAAKIANIRNINISIWGRGTVFLNSKSFKFKFLKIILLLLYKLSFILSNKIWFTNKHDLDYFKSKNMLDAKKKVVLTPNYIDTEEYNPKLIKKLQNQIY